MSHKIYITADEIEPVSCNREEQETSINWLRDTDMMEICSCDPTFITKMKHMMKRDSEHYKCFYYSCNRNLKTNVLGNYFFEVPKSLLTFRVAGEERVKKEYTDEERAEIRRRLHGGKDDKSI